MDNHAACRQMLHSLSDYIDGELSESLCQELEQHLDGCQNCQVVLDTMKKTIELYQTTSEPGSLPGGVRQSLFMTLHLEDYLTPGIPSDVQRLQTPSRKNEPKDAQ
jgi:anti-sigma factor RsiW